MLVWLRETEVDVSGSRRRGGLRALVKTCLKNTDAASKADRVLIPDLVKFVWRAKFTGQT